MKAGEITFLKLLDGKKQFVIPIYQRTYSWKQEQCAQLWSDILRAADDGVSAHFVGSIVFVQEGLYTAADTTQLLVIDGQQRLTTLSLLLIALAGAASSSDGLLPVSKEEIFDYYLINRHGKGADRYKLLLTRGDRDTLINFIEGLDIAHPTSTRVSENFDYFKALCADPQTDLAAIWRGLSKLIVVEISLDRANDNPQLIFESLNSTGVELSQADLIRNYVLMGLDVAEQTKLYNTYWYSMEQRLSKAEYVPMFDRFMRDYLTVKSKSGAIPNIYDVYTSFKTHRLHQQSVAIADIVADIYRYARYFIQLAYAESDDKDIAAALADINALKVDVAYPFLLEVFDDYAANHALSRDDLLAILRLVESYVFRRSVCGIPTNSLNKTFATLSRDIDKNHYRESVEAAFLAKDSYRRFPRDPEFTAAFTVKDVYSFRSRNYLLRKLENFERKESVTVEEYTIEHVMPQNENLSVAWRAELGLDWQQVHSTYLHTIGNLTLTAYNSEMSDKPFQEKRHLPGGFDDSPLRLNQSIAHLEHWNQEQILKRAHDLAEKASKVWPAPDLAPETLARYTRLGEATGTRSYALNETNYGSYLQGDILNLFEQLRKRVLNLDASVREEIKAYYIAYKTVTNFVDVQPQKQRLRLTLNMAFDEIDDPKELCKDVTGLGRWGNGDVEIALSSVDQLDDVMWLILQAFEKNREDADA